MNSHLINTLTFKENIPAFPINIGADTWLTVAPEDIIDLSPILNNTQLALLKGQVDDSIMVISFESYCHFAKFQLKSLCYIATQMIFRFEQQEDSSTYGCSYDLVNHKFETVDVIFYLTIIVMLLIIWGLLIIVPMNGLLN